MNPALFRLAISMASVLVASLVVVAAIVALGAFSYVALLSVMPAPIAALVTILAGLIAAVVIVVGGQWLLRRNYETSKAGTARGHRKQTEAESILEELGAFASKEATDLIRKHPQAGALAALAAGFAVGATPELRDILRRLIPH